MKKYILIPLLLLVFCLQHSFAKVEVVASLTDLASIAAAVGGDNVNVLSIARSSSDPHNVEVLPSYMVRVSRADIYLKVGLSLDQWADGIIDGSRNAILHIVDCSERVRILERPTTKVTALQGDVHPEGNPHYWLDPGNGKVIAQTIHDELAAVDPAHREAYDANLSNYLNQLDGKIAEWTAIAEALPTRQIITYHASWPYFADAFGFTIASHVEPVPGIPPTASHLAGLVEIIRGHNILAL
ncbi:MAG: metal ABC transporter substrate-binding protein, partial [Verrucomicrobia bacterium]|nr:metal ABC transporter substrate-binding protein [Verrucomicrobiota bacterium]